MFATLQSGLGEKAINQVMQNEKGPVDSVVVYYKGVYYTRSDAALQIAKLLGGFWALFLVFYILPRFIRNGIYDWVARNRYKWFGRKNECMIPTPELKARFLTE